jgi:hypothetical protein
MTVAEFRAVLAAHPEAKMHWMLPDRGFVPKHYHITEVGRLQKDLVSRLAWKSRPSRDGGQLLSHLPQPSIPRPENIRLL